MGYKIKQQEGEGEEAQNDQERKLSKYSFLSTSEGYSKDYNHINMIRDKNGYKDHFQEILEWIEKDHHNFK